MSKKTRIITLHISLQSKLPIKEMSHCHICWCDFFSISTCGVAVLPGCIRNRSAAG